MPNTQTQVIHYLHNLYLYYFTQVNSYSSRIWWLNKLEYHRCQMKLKIDFTSEKKQILTPHWQLINYL